MVYHNKIDYQKQPMQWENTFCNVIFSTCLVATLVNRLTVLYLYVHEIYFSLNTIVWLWFIIIPDLFILLILYTLLFPIRYKFPRFDLLDMMLGTSFASFIVFISSGNILMLIGTGQNVQWRFVFEMDSEAMLALFLPHLNVLLGLMIIFLLIGCIFGFIVNSHSRPHQKSNVVHFKTTKMLASIVIFMYLLVLSLYEQPQSYKKLSFNGIMNFFSEIVRHYWKQTALLPFYVNDYALNITSQAIRAPLVNISHPVVTLKKPVKHVVLIVLESIRADALPLRESFANAVKADFTSNTTVDTVTPFFNSLWKNSVHTVSSSTASYTFKSLLSIFCSMYPLNVNFLKEVTPKYAFYQKCLPELIRETFQTADNKSLFRSGLFTAAHGGFDHQRELTDKFKFDTVIEGFDIYKQQPNVSNLGWFGPSDSTIVPFMWDWIDQNLAQQETSHLFTSLILTGTHQPFAIPKDRSSDQYAYYINNKKVNNYLNTIHITDELLEEIINGFKRRKLYDDTLFVIVGDHGFVFNDYQRYMYGVNNVPLESAFSVPLMLHNPHLEAKQLDGQFTNMDVLPTIMDVLLSSVGNSQYSGNQLSSVQHNQLQSILSQYEGTSIIRMPVKHQPIRYTFHLANPGNSFITIKQYPNKLTYDTGNDKVSLYHLQYDPFEFVDLLALDNNTPTYPSWLTRIAGEHTIQTWEGRWLSHNVNVTRLSKISSQKETLMSISKSNTTVQLKDMLEWADQTFELARLWRNIVMQRYLHGSVTFHRCTDNH